MVSTASSCRCVDGVDDAVAPASSSSCRDVLQRTARARDLGMATTRQRALAGFRGHHSSATRRERLQCWMNVSKTRCGDSSWARASCTASAQGAGSVLASVLLAAS